jgi:hypothetical protein
MSDPAFTVLTTRRFDRLLRSLDRRHPDLAERFATAIAILGADPYNRSREHTIRKLESVHQGEGQYRLRLVVRFINTYQVICLPGVCSG